jgi:two-component system alkaline phosphatase synthesis response regulator PhoP
MKKKILFVDDESDLLRVSSIRLRKTGYDVFEAIDGEEALDLARERMPDLILLDVFLPKMQGDEVARILKGDEKLKHIPIILISADVVNLEKKFKECGANDYLTKPFASGELIDMIKRYEPR